jgi:hypothetical protein
MYLSKGAEGPTVASTLGIVVRLDIRQRYETFRVRLNGKNG